MNDVTINGHVIGDKVGSRHMCFMKDKDSKKLYCAYYSLIQVDGNMHMVSDQNSIGKALNAPTRKEARKLASEARDRIKAKALIGDTIEQKE